MEFKDNNIDPWLKLILGNAEVDAEGIDWNAFQQKQSKKRRYIWFWFLSLAMFGLILVLIPWTFQLDKNPPKYGLDEAQKTVDIVSKKEYNRPMPESRSADKKNFENKVNGFSSRILRTGVQVVNVGSNKNPSPKAATTTDLNSSEIKWRQDFTNVYSQKIKFEFLPRIKENPKRIEDEIPYVAPIVKNVFNHTTFWQLQAGGSWSVPQVQVSSLGKAFIHKDYEQIRKSSEKGIAGYGFQMGLGKAKGENWLFSIGLGISTVEIKGIYNYQYSEKPIIDIDGKIINYTQTASSSIEFEATQKIVFSELPISVQYLFKPNASRTLGVKMGMVPQVLNRISGELPNSLFLDHKDKLQNSNFKNKSLSMEMGLPYYIKLNQRSAVALLPFYRVNFGLNQVQSLYKSNLNNWGITCSYLSAF